MTTGQCVICTRDNPHGFVCATCVTQLAADLYTLAWLAAELMVTRTRQDRLPASAGSNTQQDRPHCDRCAPDPTDPIQLGSSPLLVHTGASNAYSRLHNAMTTWVRDWWRVPEPWPANMPASMARWLMDRIDRVRRDAGADTLAREIEHHTKTALEIINPLDPNQQTYGICGAEYRDGTCTAYLYGEPRATWVRCRHCRTQHDAQQRIHLLEQRVRTLYFRAATLARLLPRLIERPVSANNIRSWLFHGRPIRTGVDEGGWITYHTGDVINVALATPTRNRPAKEAG